MNSHIFNNRDDAGKKLAEKLIELSGNKNAIVLALPRGGVPVAIQVAARLSLPLDLMLVRKLGVPGNEELAMGALAMGNVIYLNEGLIDELGISDDAIKKVADKEQKELERRNALYRAGKPAPDINGKTVIVVDDGLATGATMHAAISALREGGAKEIIAAVPVGADSTCRELGKLTDKIICLSKPEPFYNVGQWYRDFSQVSDKEVQKLLKQTAA